MARALRWTEAAVGDLNEAAEFIARDSPFYRLIYQITPDHVIILAFVHGARDLTKRPC